MPSASPAPCSIPRTAWPGLAFCARRGADLRSTICTGSPAPTIPNCSPAPFRNCSPSASRCSAKTGQAPPAESSKCGAHSPLCVPPSQPPPREPGSNRSGCGWAAQTASTPPRAPISISCGAALTACPRGEQDLPGPALDAALDRLTALPDPDGQQRLRGPVDDHPQIKRPGVRGGHRSRPAGRTIGGKREMLSWLERGLAQPDEFGEKLLSSSSLPSSPKAQIAGEAKAWVDRVYREREVAGRSAHSLRCRDPRPRGTAPLRPPCLQDRQRWAVQSGRPAKNSLLATAWPALEEEVRERFEEWKACQRKISSQRRAGNRIHCRRQREQSARHAHPRQANSAPPSPAGLSTRSPESAGAPSFPRFPAERVGAHKSPGGPGPRVAQDSILRPGKAGFRVLRVSLLRPGKARSTPATKAAYSPAHSVSPSTRLLEELARLRDSHRMGTGARRSQALRTPHRRPGARLRGRAAAVRPHRRPGA